MSNIPRSLTDSALNLFKLAISASEPWPFSFSSRNPSRKTGLGFFSQFWVFVFLASSIWVFFEMRSGDKMFLNFHLHAPHLHHHHHHGKREGKDIPKGCVAVMVGQGEEQQRIIIPVIYVNHPLFTQLLKEAEEEFGFDHEGPINIPCHVEEFRHVQGLIDQEDHHHHHHHLLCFRV